MNYTAEDYRTAPSGEGPLAAEWADKPHRLVYDLVAALKAKDAEIERLREQMLQAISGLAIEKRVEWKRAEDAEAALRERDAQLAAENQRAEEAARAWRCFHCNQLFTSEIMAESHFGKRVSDLPKCIECIRPGATVGGGPHDPYLRVLKSEWERIEQRLAAEKKARGEAEQNSMASLPGRLQEKYGHIDAELFYDCGACGSRIPAGGINVEALFSDLDDAARSLSGDGREDK